VRHSMEMKNGKENQTFNLFFFKSFSNLCSYPNTKVIQLIISHTYRWCEAEYKNFNFNLRVTEFKTNILSSQYKEVEGIILYGMKKFLTFKNDILRKTFPNLKKLILHLNNDIELTRQFSNFMKNFQFIEYLDIRSMKIDQNSENIFSSLTQLKKLFLSGSEIQELPPKIFSELKNLEVFNLGYNKLKVLPENIFKSLTQLKELGLSRIEIQELPPKIFSELKNLEVLNLGPKLKVLPENIFKSLTQLKELDLSGNEIQELPPKIFSELKNLEVLGLGLNELKVLPENIFSSLVKLKGLHLNHNKMEILPENLLKNNINLAEFSVLGNKLKEIYVDFRTLPKIQQFSIGSSNECIDFSCWPCLTSKIHEEAEEILEKCKNRHN
jgi:Leucine-rich repeat (LRR) protein